jgi:hypothetical protein
MNKWVIATSGTVENLKNIANISIKDAAIIASAIVAIQDASGNALKLDKLSSIQEARIASLQKAKDSAAKASAGMSASDQVAAKKKIKSLEDEIKKINEAASARKKAMQDQQAGADALTQIQKKQLDYQQALAAGDQAAAAQAQLDIQQVTSSRQTQMAMNSVDINAAAQAKPLQDQIDKLSAKLNAAADSQVIAAESFANSSEKLAELQKKETTLREKLATAMTNKDAKGNPTADNLRNLADAYADFNNLQKKNNKWIGADGKPLDEKALFDSLSNLATQSMTVAAQNVVIQAAKLTNGSLGTGSNGTGTKAPTYDPKAAAKADSSGKPAPVAIRPGTTVTETFINTDPKHPEFRKAGTVIPNSFIVTPYAYKSTDSAGNPITFTNHGEVINNATGLQEGVWFGIQGLQKQNVVFPNATKKAMGGFIGHYGLGSPGGVKGPGTGISDSIPAYLSNGEYVIKAAAVQKYGVPTFDALNSQKFNIPSLVTDTKSMYNNSSGGSVIYLTQNITAADGMDTELLSMRIVEMTKKAIHADVQVASAKIGGTKEFGSKVMH